MTGPALFKTLAPCDWSVVKFDHTISKKHCGSAAMTGMCFYLFFQTVINYLFWKFAVKDQRVLWSEIRSERLVDSGSHKSDSELPLGKDAVEPSGLQVFLCFFPCLFYCYRCQAVEVVTGWEFPVIITWGAFYLFIQNRVSVIRGSPIFWVGWSIK